MIVPVNATSKTMKKALSYSIAALNAASELDLDRTEEDRSFFAKERDTLLPLLTGVTTAERAEEDEELNNSIRLQVRVSLGDAVLDRGVVDGKERMKLDTKRREPEAANHVFGERTSDTTRAPILEEPAAVLAILARLEHASPFPQKEAIHADLVKRVSQQNACIQDRSAGEARGVVLRSATVQSIRIASDSLYGLEKRLLERFKRDTDYVKKFFLDVSPNRKNKEEETPTEKTQA